MTPAQEQAANAARKACIAWMDKNRAHLLYADYSQAISDAWREWSQDLPYAHEIKSAYLAAWHTTLETA